MIKFNKINMTKMMFVIARHIAYRRPRLKMSLNLGAGVGSTKICNSMRVNSK